MSSSRRCAHPFLLCSILTMLSCWRSNTLMIAFSLTPTSPGNHTDQLALLEFKSQISHDPLRLLDSWNTTLHFCQWQGVTCGGPRRQRVVELVLKSHGLAGSLSPYIGNLSFLHTINLENNSFHGEIPSEALGRLLMLHTFALGNNSFTGMFPSNLSRNLEFLSLGCNMLTGSFPNQLCALKKLEVLRLWRSNLTGSLPYCLGNLSSLQFIDLSSNYLEGGIPSSLGQLKSLNFLGLDENMLSSKLPPSIYNLSSLWTLGLTKNLIVDRLPSDIGRTFLPNLREMFIGANHFFGPLPPSLFNISTLQMLELSENDFTGEVPNNMGNMPKLQVLSFYANKRLGSSGRVDDLEFISSLNSTVLRVLQASRCQLSGDLHKSLANISFTGLEELLLTRNQISGTIPSEISIKLPNLTNIQLSDNFLTGNIPRGIGKLKNLRILTLGNNNLSGQIPSSINNLTGLLYLDLSNNNFESCIIPKTRNLQSLLGLDLTGNKLKGTLEQVFDQPSHSLLYAFLANNSFIGSLPIEVGNFRNLVALDVSNNRLTSEIPNTLGKCLSLQNLSLKGNSFQGSIPSSFTSLQGLQLLDLSLNNLSGEIPMFLQNLSSSLQYLDLSFNKFEGAMPTQGIFQNTSAFSILGNSKLCGGISELNLPTCPDHKQNNSSKKHRISLRLKIAIVVGLSVIVLAALLLAVLFRLVMRRPKNGINYMQNNLHDHFERVSFLELHRATDGFSPANLIGIGHFGSVFKGIIGEGTSLVAVKVLNMINQQATKSFITECEALRNVRHRNLMKILTACSTVDLQGNDFKALVFKFMTNGSLENWLHPIASNGSHLIDNLNLSRRLEVAIDVASALDYLHNQCETPIIHCDLKPSNILLDEDMVAHVGDFGLAKFLERKDNDSETTNATSSFSPRGTIGYIPPEYGIGVKPSTQGDMYSYGVLLLEMFTGKRPTDEMFKDGLDLHQFCKTALNKQVMKIIDPRMLELELEQEACNHQDIHVISYSKIHGSKRQESGRVEECISSVVKVGVGCSMSSASERMDIKNALKELVGAYKKLDVFLLDRVSR